MARVDLYKLALENEAKLKESYDALALLHAKASVPNKVEDFYNHCEGNWSVSMNLTQDRLDFFLQNGHPYNVYRFHAASGRPVYKEKGTFQDDESPIDWDHFQALLGSWGPRRRVFNEFAHREEEFCYGAYYLRGKGIFRENYGRYLVVMKKDLLRNSERLTFLEMDSLQRYTLSTASTSETSELFEAILREEIAHGGSVTWLVATKVASLLETMEVDQCIDFVCTADDYLEAHIAEDLTFEHVDKVVMRKLSADEADYFAEFLGATNPLNPTELGSDAQKNAYFYIQFSSEFPRKGIHVEFFAE